MIWRHFIFLGRNVQFQNSVHRYVFSLKILWQRLRIKALGIYVNFRHYCTHPSSSVIKDFDNSWYIRREQSSLSFLYFAVKVHHSVYLDLLATKKPQKRKFYARRHQCCARTPQAATKPTKYSSILAEKRSQNWIFSPHFGWVLVDIR